MTFPPSPQRSDETKRGTTRQTRHGAKKLAFPLAKSLRFRTKLGVGVLAAAGVATGIGFGVAAGLAPGPAPAADLAQASAVAGTAPQLHVSGNELVSASGQRIVLHGVDRSGTEFMCVQGHGIFDGPSDLTSINVMKAHGVNAVRVPLNEACWNGDSYVNPASSGAHYRHAVEAYVRKLNGAGLVAILDLHWTDGQYTGPASACSSAQAVCQKAMPDQAGATRFWSSMAHTFGGNDAVIFDLFNEPYPDQATQGNEAAAWRCWLHGGNCTGFSYPVAGMQTMVNAVRSAGANNVLMLGGLTWSNDLTGWLSHKPIDPDHNLAASWHSYNFNGCSTTSCWNSQIAPVIAKVPLIAGEIGENDCAATYITGLTKWLDAKSANYLAWTWNADFNCASGPGLITNYNGSPTPFGAGYEAVLKQHQQH